MNLRQELQGQMRIQSAVVRSLCAPLLLVCAAYGAIFSVDPVVVGIVAAVALACYACGAKRSEWMSWALIAASIADAVARRTTEGLWPCLAQGASYGSVMVAISFVQPAARASVVAESIAHRIARNAHLSRSWQAHALAHAAGATLNLSGLLIVQAAVHRAARPLAERIAAAVTFLRGFATAPVWSPYSYFVPIVLAAFPTIEWYQVAVVGLLISGPFLLASLRRPPDVEMVASTTTPGPGSGDNAAMPRAKSRRWIIFCAFFASVLTLLTFGGLGSLTMVIVVLPPLAVAWGLLEAAAQARPRGFTDGVVLHVTRQLPALRTEVLALVAAGMASQALGGWFRGIGIPALAAGQTVLFEIAQAIVIFLLIVLFTGAGINPILFVSPLAALSSTSGTGGLPVTVALVIACCAWALFPTVSPFAAANLVTGRETGVAVRDLITRVNRQYNLCALSLSVLLIVSTVALVHFGYLRS